MSTRADGQRTIRVLATGPFVLLVFCIAASALRSGTFETSISAYYGGPVRDVFVGSLVASALAFVAYRGTNDLEDLALDAAGFFAPFVAFVPWNVGLPDAADAGDLKVTLTGYLVMAAAVTVALRVGLRRSSGRLWHSSRLTRLLVATAVLALVWQAGLVIERLLEPHTGFAWVHPSAALLLVVSMFIAIASQLVAPRHRGARWDPDSGLPRSLRVVYGLLLAGMALGGPLLYLGLREIGKPDYFFWAEALEFSLFVAYWCCELARHWSVTPELPRRRPRSLSV